MDDYANDASTTALLDLSFADNFGAIDYAGDQDWLRMELAGGTSYEIHVHGQDLGFQLAQPQNQDFRRCQPSDRRTVTSTGRRLYVLTFTALSYGTHYLAINLSDPAEIGNYNFHGFGDDNSGSARLSINGQSLGRTGIFHRRRRFHLQADSWSFVYFRPARTGYGRGHSAGPAAFVARQYRRHPRQRRQFGGGRGFAHCFHPYRIGRLFPGGAGVRR